MVRLDHNRAISQLAEKTGKPVTSIKKMPSGATTASPVPRPLPHRSGCKIAYDLVNDHEWYEKTYIPPWPSAARPSSRPASQQRRQRRQRRHRPHEELGTRHPEGDWTAWPSL